MTTYPNKRYRSDIGGPMFAVSRPTRSCFSFVMDEKKRQLATLLNDMRQDIDKNGYDALKRLFIELTKKVESFIEITEEQFENLKGEIQDLRKEIEILKAENASLALAQSTLVWEAHVARFVVDPQKKIFPYRRFKQMNDYLKDGEVDHDYWIEIQKKINEWTPRHWDVVKAVREERNGIAHPELVDLDLVEQEITTMSPTDQEKMRTMLDILKMTASLMKFGRLASKSDLSLKLNPEGKNVLKIIISWDRKFEQIGSLQNTEHEEAKRYLKMYVGESHPMIHHYVDIVDSIKEVNRQRLGKLAQDFAKRNRIRQSTSEALQTLMDLLPNDHRRVMVLDKTLAKLHIPDFLPKHLWKDGIDIVENY